jgi:hypothetical protein
MFPDRHQSHAATPFLKPKVPLIYMSVNGKLDQDFFWRLHFTYAFQYTSYCHVDYAVAGALDGLPPDLPVGLTYDIGCKYGVYFEDRMIQFFPHVYALARNIDILVPSMHILGHKEDCQYRFALPYTQGAGRHHGEGVEHPWAETNQASGSVREMNAGHRHDTLHEIFCFWNWKKIQGMGMLILTRLCFDG